MKYSDLKLDLSMERKVRRCGRRVKTWCLERLTIACQPLSSQQPTTRSLSSRCMQQIRRAPGYCLRPFAQMRRLLRSAGTDLRRRRRAVRRAWIHRDHHGRHRPNGPTWPAPRCSTIPAEERFPAEVPPVGARRRSPEPGAAAPGPARRPAPPVPGGDGQDQPAARRESVAPMDAAAADGGVLREPSLDVELAKLIEPEADCEIRPGNTRPAAGPSWLLVVLPRGIRTHPPPFSLPEELSGMLDIVLRGLLAAPPR